VREESLRTYADRNPCEREEPDVSTSEETLDVLREIWHATGQRAEDVEAACGPQKACKSTSAVGFDGMVGPDGDLRTAWRAALERDGKLTPKAHTVRDLVLGSEDRDDLDDHAS
jgi:hypothetical protein